MLRPRLLGRPPRPSFTSVSRSDDPDDHGAAEPPRDRPTAFNSADPPRNFSLTVGERIRALTIGAPAYATRKKHIEDLEDRYASILRSLRNALVGRGLPEHEIRRALQDRAATLELKKLNTLITAHNRYYPLEANLAMDPRTGEYLVYGRRWEPTLAWTVERLVEAALDAA